LVVIVIATAVGDVDESRKGAAAASSAMMEIKIMN